jgi:excisionase family DNA binding protein
MLTSAAETRDKNRSVISVQANALHRPAPPRLGLTVAEAAQAVGMSESSFKRHVQPELRIVRRGSLRIIPLSEVEKWLERNATLAGPAGSRVR